DVVAEHGAEIVELALFLRDGDQRPVAIVVGQMAGLDRGGSRACCIHAVGGSLISGDSGQGRDSDGGTQETAGIDQVLHRSLLDRLLSYPLKSYTIYKGSKRLESR